jgi:hypothetical protein
MHRSWGEGRGGVREARCIKACGGGGGSVFTQIQMMQSRPAQCSRALQEGDADLLQKPEAAKQSGVMVAYVQVCFDDMKNLKRQSL